ncbi:MAG: FadR family transcriptional regulator [bacterium]|nr:FadR family transcriptional regulator [bacterium]
MKFEPINSKSLKNIFIERFENLILSGNLSIGDKLPSERVLAEQLKVSRPVVHEGLLDLASKGLVTMKPRSGAFVNDFRRYGSLELVQSLFNYHEGFLAPNLLDSILHFRKLFEVEIAALAATNHSDSDAKDLKALLDSENSADPTDIKSIAQIDFDFHHLLAIASGNIIYPLIVNSFKNLYLNLLELFYRDSSVVSQIFADHKLLIELILSKNGKKAAEKMGAMMLFAEEHLTALMQRIAASNEAGLPGK